MTEQPYMQKYPSDNRKITYSSADYRHFQIILVMRISYIVCFLMLVGNVILSLALMQLSEQMRVDSVLVSKQSRSGEMVDIEPVAEDMNGISVLNDVMVKYYLKMRHTVIPDKKVMEFRWGQGGILNRLSSPDVYRKFYKNRDAFKAKIADVGSGREQPAEIEIIDFKKPASNLWNIDFDIITYSRFTGKETRQRWNASLRARNYKSRELISSSLINPLGFVVTEYNLAPKIVK
ncbi:MAG: hypothetical protein IKD08_03230 [Alphaproteobacteria bacterium]|nr:hypothetical protein [Alphaproteobacteria bacterium]